MAGKYVDCYTTDGYIVCNEFSRSPRDTDILRDLNNKNRHKKHKNEAQIYKAKIVGKTTNVYEAMDTGSQFYFFTTKREKDMYLKSIK